MIFLIQSDTKLYLSDRMELVMWQGNLIRRKKNLITRKDDIYLMECFRWDYCKTLYRVVTNQWHRTTKTKLFSTVVYVQCIFLIVCLVMGCSLFLDKPLPEPMLTSQTDPKEHNSIKFCLKCNVLHSRTCIGKCRHKTMAALFRPQWVNVPLTSGDRVISV